MLPIVGIGIGVALMIWMPVDEAAGLAIAGGSGTIIAVAIVTRVAMANPWLIWTALLTCLGGLAWLIWSNWVRPTLSTAAIGPKTGDSGVPPAINSAASPQKG